MHNIMLLSVRAVGRLLDRPNHPLPMLLASIFEHSGKLIYPRYTKWHNENKTKKLESILHAWLSTLDFTGHSFIFHPTLWKSTTSHENIFAVQSCYAYRIQLSVLGPNACAVPTFKSLVIPAYPGSPLLCITSFHQPTSPTSVCSEWTKLTPFTSFSGAGFLKQHAKLYSASQASKVHHVDNNCSAGKSVIKAKVSSRKYTTVYKLRAHLVSLAVQESRRNK